MNCLYITLFFNIVAGHGNSVQLMFVAILELPELLGWALRRLAVVGPVSC